MSSNASSSVATVEPGTSNFTISETAAPSEPATKPQESKPEVIAPEKKPSPSDDASFNTEKNGSGSSNENAVDEDDNKSDLLFKKKDVKKPRAQSIQSVLSTASLKSLKHQYINNPPNFSRNARIVSTGDNARNINQPTATLNNTNNNSTNNLISSMKNSKNFQSFIQAPVLSSISNLKNDNIEIGQQLPFNDNGNRLDPSKSTENQPQTNDNDTNSDDYYDDQDTILQQQKLTINALKKLSLSPMPIINQETKKLTEKKSSEKVGGQQEQKTDVPAKKSQPYQPAEVDLSSFASLTRQKGSNLSINTENIAPASNPASAGSNLPSATDTLPGANLVGSMSSTMSAGTNRNLPSPSPSSLSNKTGQYQRHNANLPSLSEHKLNQTDSRQSSVMSQEAREQATINYHKEVRESHLNNYRPLVNNSIQGKPPAAVLPPSDMNARHAQQPPPIQPIVNGKDKHLQQIKGFRNPMYIPAVLRMTLNNQNEASNLDSSPHQKYPLNDSYANSYNSTRGEERNANNNSQLLATYGEPSSSSKASLRSFDSNKSNDESIPSSPMVSPPLSTTGPYKLYNKKKYDEISRSAPTRKHWLKDESVIKCGITSCPKYFNFFERRHHCRKCGGIYCKEHTSHYLYINHLAQFTTGGRGTLSKVCDYCIEEYNEFMKHEFGVDINSSCHDLHDTKDTFVPEDYMKPAAKKVRKPSNEDRLTELPPRGAPIHSEIKIGSGIADSTKNEQLVGSVPANWSWSSF